MQFGIFGTTIKSLDADADILGIGFGVFDGNIPVAIVVKNSCIEQFVLGARPVALIFFEQLGIGILALRILIEHPHIAVRGCAVEVKPVFLDVLAMNAFVAGKTEHSLFQNWITPVPQRQREYEQLIAVADSGNAIFTPAI